MPTTTRSNTRSKIFSSILPIVLCTTLHSVFAAEPPQKEASTQTRALHQALLEQLPFDDKTDFENAERGFIASLDSPILNESGGVVQDMQKWNFVQGKAPVTANPSLWRQSQLVSRHGLFKVSEGIYQVRGFDLANMSFIRGKSGWIVVDPLTVTATAKAAYELLQKKVAAAPISAVIITHSHVDHFGGVKGILSEEEFSSKNVPLIAPEDFFEAAVSENLIAGNQMTRRASYMFGSLLPATADGTLGSGLGTTNATGEVTIVKPTVTISEQTPQEHVVDGVKMQFFSTPGAEAPAELMFYLPEHKALMQAEEINHTLHNLYTLRGAKVRSGLLWAKYIHRTIEWYGDEVEISFGSHHWPTWGNTEIVDFWKGQRDTYRYIHDEVLRLANHGGTMLEVAEEIKLPDSLTQAFANRGYYGSVNHNAKAQYNLYFGFFGGNPADLHPLPPQQAGIKFVEYMGGAERIIEKAQRDYDRGEYRFAATALNHLVFAQADNTKAKQLLATIYDQMGFQAESAPWRNFYLSAAQELRHGVPSVAMTTTASADIIKSLPLDAYLDYLAVLLNGPKAAGKTMVFNVHLPDTQQRYVMYVENGVLNYTLDKKEAAADASITMNLSVVDAISMGTLDPAEAVKQGEISIEGSKETYFEFLSLLDSFDLWFNIVTP